MISLIVCSINEMYLQQLKQNVSERIGVEHEWLVWDNKESNRGLCEVYNQLAAKAKYPYICFLHEDVIIEAQDWGNVLHDLFLQDQEVGLIGVAGGKYKSELFSGWYSGGKGLDYFSVIHRLNGKDEKLLAPKTWPEREMQVATIDGLFMFCKKEVWANTQFNDQLLKGFHYYDIDFSLRVAMSFKVLVTDRLNIIHYTKGGDFGDKWLADTIAFHHAYKEQLPFSVAPNVQKDINIVVSKYWLDWLKNMDISVYNKYKWLQLQKLYLYPALWYSILKFILYKPLRLKKIHQLWKQKAASK